MLGIEVKTNIICKLKPNDVENSHIDDTAIVQYMNTFKCFPYYCDICALKMSNPSIFGCSYQFGPVGHD